MTQAVSWRSLTAVVWILFQANRCGTSGGKSKTETEFSTGTYGFPCWHRKINAPYSFTYSLIHTFIHHRRYTISVTYVDRK